MNGEENTLNTAASFINSTYLDRLKHEAAASPNLRSRLCLHCDTQSPVQEMINVFCHDSYLRPHRHPQGKTESYHIIEGVLRVYLFDELGVVNTYSDLCNSDPKAPFLFYQPGGLWHMPVAMTPFVVFHEVYTGPFEEGRDVEYADWSPEPQNPVSVNAFKAGLP
ncbi:MAG: WbuC family cupin fold metalloprotein [Candidatus Sedimenticola sp. (ex Thyasira tokunagai)]